MIKCDNGVFEAKGTEVELLSDLCTIIRDVREALAKNHGEQRADKMLGELVKVAFMTDEELEENAERCAEKMVMKGLFDLLKEVFK